MATTGEVGRRILEGARLSPCLYTTCSEALARPGRLFSEIPIWSRVFLGWIEAVVPPPYDAFLPAAAACEYMVTGYDLLDAVYDRDTFAPHSTESSTELAASYTLVLLAQEVMAHLELPAERRTKAGAVLGRAGRRAVEAHARDYALRRRADPVPEAELLQILEHRSGTLVAAPCQCATLLAGAPWRTVALAGRFGSALGCAAQLEDDLADRHEDERDGRWTVPVMLGRLHPERADLVETATWVLIRRFLIIAARTLGRLSATHDCRTEALWKLLPPDLRNA